MVLSPTLAPDMSSSSSKALAKIVLSPATSISPPSGASSCMPSSQVFQRGTALPPLRAITAMAASSSMAWMPPSDAATAWAMAFATLVMVRP